MPTTIKAALKKWEEATGRKAGEAKEIKLIGVYPPIEKMEGPFHLLINCEKFSLSTNFISNVQNLQAFKNLKILSLGRNVIKTLQVLCMKTKAHSQQLTR
jgi:dynein light chain 1